MDEARGFARFMWEKEVHIPGEPHPGDFMQDDPYQTFDFGWTFVLKEGFKAPRRPPEFVGMWSRMNEDMAVLITKIGSVIWPSKEPFGCTMEQHVRQLEGMARRNGDMYEKVERLPYYFSYLENKGHPPVISSNNTI